MKVILDMKKSRKIVGSLMHARGMSKRNTKRALCALVFDFDEHVRLVV